MGRMLVLMGMREGMEPVCMCRMWMLNRVMCVSMGVKWQDGLALPSSLPIPFTLSVSFSFAPCLIVKTSLRPAIYACLLTHKRVYCERPEMRSRRWLKRRLRPLHSLPLPLFHIPGNLLCNTTRAAIWNAHQPLSRAQNATRAFNRPKPALPTSEIPQVSLNFGRAQQRQ
jgi:hypothetical protein